MDRNVLGNRNYVRMGAVFFTDVTQKGDSLCDKIRKEYTNKEGSAFNVFNVWGEARRSANGA